MAFGFTPKYVRDIPLDGLDPTQFLALCVSTARTLGWDILSVSDAGLITFTNTKWWARGQKLTIRIFGEAAHLLSQSTGSEMFDMGRNRKTIEKFLLLLAGTKADNTAEQLTQAYEEIKPQLVPPASDMLVRPPEKGSGFFTLFVPRKGFFATPILMDINLAVFILMVVSGVNFFLPDTQSLLQWGANIRLLTLDGEWWRLITNVFIHIGIIHIVFNMYALLYIGIFLEPILGGWRFLIAYFLTGIIASVASLYWHSNVVSAGASGAIFGMYGVFLALLTTNLMDKKSRTPLLASIGIFVAYNLLNGTKAGIDNAAHVGGLVSGIMIGYLFYPGLRNSDKPGLRYGAMGFATLVAGAITVWGCLAIPNDFPRYQDKINAFGRLEKQAVAILRPADNEAMVNMAAAIRDTGIRNWRVSIKILHEARQLDVPEPLKQRTDMLIQYCSLRLDSYGYYYRKLTNSTGSGEDSIGYYEAQIKEVMDKLKH